MPAFWGKLGDPDSCYVGDDVVGLGRQTHIIKIASLFPPGQVAAVIAS